MFNARFAAQSLVLLLLTLVAGLPANAGPTKAQLDRIANNLKNLPAERQRLLSSGLNRILRLDEALNDDHAKMGDDGGTATVPKARAAARTFAAAIASAIPGPGPGGTIPVSDPRLDFTDAVTAGFSQSETSSARCGNNVVSGYNDSGAFNRTAGVDPAAAWSFSSASYSHDGGLSFTDIGFLNPGTIAANFIVGDPVVACTSPTRFYYTSIFASSEDANGNFFNGVAINTSNDGGETWGPPVAAVAKDFNHQIDKPWLAADPTNPRRLFVTYTDFDSAGFFGDPSAACPDDFRTAIELVSSRDAGATWSAPVVIRQDCYYGGGFNSTQGSNVVVGPNGTVYVGYEYYPAALPNNEIHLVRSTESEDHRLRFRAPVKVADVWPNGNFGNLQGGFRNNEFPQLAVDRSSGPSRGTIYVAWSDGSRNIVPNLTAFFGDYAYPDVVVAKSSDGGRHFTAPMTVSPAPSSFTGRGRDQFFPGIAVDNRGVVGVCYYDRRQHPSNDVADRYCATSQNGGASWSEQRVSAANWTPVHAADDLLNLFYMGDYDAISSDFLLQNSGFFSTFEVVTNGNPDVVGAGFR
jgi:hypothetical protein